MESPVLPSLEDKSDEHAPRAKLGRVGSDFDGEQRGQEICSAADKDDMQTSASRDRLQCRFTK